MKRIILSLQILLLVLVTSFQNAKSSDDPFKIIKGRYTCIGTPCTEAECLPCAVLGIISNDEKYCLEKSGGGSCGCMEGFQWNLPWNRYAPKLGDIVIAGGETHYIFDKYGEVYHFMHVAFVLPAMCPLETIYGEHSKETQLLRSLRDNILSQSHEGRELIKLYYKWSPVIVRAMEEEDDFKEEVKEVIDGLLGIVE